MDFICFRFKIFLGFFIGICIFFVQCTDESNFQEHNLNAYEKIFAVSKVLVKSACEKSKLQVSCPKGQVISFVQASYGRKELAKCNPNKNKQFNVKCKAAKSDAIMKQKCHLKRSCTVEASNTVFGDPCRKTIKYLEMKYKCATEKVTKKPVIKKTTPKAVVTPKKVVTPKIPPIIKTSTTNVVTKKDTTLDVKPTEKTTEEVTFEDTTLMETTTDITFIDDVTPTTNPITIKTDTPLAESTEPPTTQAPLITFPESSEPPTTQTPRVTFPESTEPPTTQAPRVTFPESTEPPTKDFATTQPPRVTAPDTYCDPDDLDCIIADLGTDWFVCESDMGSYPHPTSKKLFIFCLNWKPKVKKCGRNGIFSEELMTCVSS